VKGIERVLDWLGLPVMPCRSFEDNGSLGCLRCEWNLAAHTEDPRYAGKLGEAMIEKPLHVRVAEALGCEPRWTHSAGWFCDCTDHAHAKFQSEYPGPDERGRPHGIRHYYTDWSAGGPLIERFGITVMLAPYADEWPGLWHACLEQHPWDSHQGINTEGRTPLVAVCNLIIALHAGRPTVTPL